MATHTARPVLPLTDPQTHLRRAAGRRRHKREGTARADDHLPCPAVTQKHGGLSVGGPIRDPPRLPTWSRLTIGAGSKLGFLLPQ
jgi:hypothetical protein